MAKYKVVTYARKDNGFKLPLSHREFEAIHLDDILAEVQQEYRHLFKKTKHKFTHEIEQEASHHAYALFAACDKMQVINRTEDARYVLEIERISK